MAAETLAAAIMALIPNFEQTLDTTIIVNDTGYTGIEVKEWKRAQACDALGMRECDFPLGYFNHYQNPNGDSDVMDFTMPNGQTGSICFLNMPKGSNETHATLSYLDGKMAMRNFIYENQRATYTPSSGDLRGFNLLMQISGCANAMWLGENDSATLDRDIAFSAMFHQLANGDPSFLAEGGDTAVRYLVEGMRSDVGMTAVGEVQRILVEHWKSSVGNFIADECGTVSVSEGSGPLFPTAKPIGHVAGRMEASTQSHADSVMDQARAEMSGGMTTAFGNTGPSEPFSDETMQSIYELGDCLEDPHSANMSYGQPRIAVTEELLEFLIPSYPKIYVEANSNAFAMGLTNASIAGVEDAPGNGGFGSFYTPMLQYGPFEAFNGNGAATLQYAWDRANQLAGISR